MGAAFDHENYICNVNKKCLHEDSVIYSTYVNKKSGFSSSVGLRTFHYSLLVNMSPNYVDYINNFTFLVFSVVFAVEKNRLKDLVENFV